MASITNSNTRLNDADATTGWASDGGGGAGPQTEPDLGYQLTSGSDWSVSRKVGTTKGGHGYTHGSTTDMTAAATRVFMAKAVWYNSINTSAYPACGIKIGNDDSNFQEYAVYASDSGLTQFSPDPKQLFRIIPIDPNVAEWPAVITGTVTLTTLDFFGVQGDFGGSAKAENVAMDAVDLAGDDGVLFLIGTAGSFGTFLLADENAITPTARYGYISTVRESVLDVYGKLWIGRNSTPTATLTEFDDSGLTILFPDGYYGEEWTGIGLDLGNASTAITMSDIVFIGQGQPRQQFFFRTVDDVDVGGGNTIRLRPEGGLTPRFVRGTPLLYSNEGGSDAIGLTNSTVYWMSGPAGVAGDYENIEFYALRDTAFLNGTAVTLTAATGTNESHSLTIQPDIRPVLDVTGTSGTAIFSRCTFDNFKLITTTTAVTFNNCIFRSCREIDMTTNNGGVFNTCIFNITAWSTIQGESLITTNTTANIDDCTFNKEKQVNSSTIVNRVVGHAIDVDTAGSYALDGNLFTGDAWWTSPDNENGAGFDTTSGVGVDDTNNDITTSSAHGLTTGDPVYYNDNGGTDTIGLTDGDRYYANVISTTNFSLHVHQEDAVADNDRVGLNNTGTGEIHTFYSAQACVVNSSGGAVTLTIGGGGDAPSVRNIGASTTTLVISPVTLTIKAADAVTGADLQNCRVLVTPSNGTGPLDFEESVTIATSGTTATVTKTTHGYATNDIIQIRGANESELNCVATITVTGASTFTYTIVSIGGASGTGSITATQVIISGLTDVNGEISKSLALASDQPIEGNVRLSSASPFYKTGIIISGTIYDSAVDTNVTVPMIRDD